MDQSIEKFLAATEQFKPDIIGMSALLTTTMTYMKTVMDGYKERGLTHINLPSAARPSARCLPTKSARTATARMRPARWICFFYFMGKGAAPKAKSKIETIAEVKAEREQSRAAARAAGAKSKFQILYWQDIPVRRSRRGTISTMRSRWNCRSASLSALMRRRKPRV